MPRFALLEAADSFTDAANGLRLADPASPDWSLLKESSLYAAVAAVVLVVAVSSWSAVKGQWHWSINPGADWDFSDSWASNVTIGASALAAVFGSSDVVTAVGGEDATVAPLIVVGSALALAAVTSAPLVVKVCTTGNKIWTLGVSVAATITLWAAVFEGLVILRLAADLSLGGIESSAPWVGIALGALLAVYAWRSLRALVAVGDSELDNRGFAPGTRRRAAIL